MKILIVGGTGQGKAAFAHSAYRPKEMRDGETCAIADAFGGDALDRLHLLIRRLMDEGIDPLEYVTNALAGRDSWLLICDEIGGGIVPLDPFEREWRESVGRICCELARQAQVVKRLCCGLPQRLKG